MKDLFYGCTSLKELDLSNFNTENITDMSYMFYNCSSLKKLNISNFNVNKVKVVNYMFYGCSSLTDVIFSESYIYIPNILYKDTQGVCNKCPKLVEKFIADNSSFFYIIKPMEKINLKIFILENN